MRRDGGKARALKERVRGPLAIEPLDRPELVDAAGGLAVEPGEKPRHRRAVAPLGVDRPLNLDLVLDGLGDQHGIVGLDEAGARRLQPLQEPEMRLLRVREHPGAAQAVESRQESVGGLDGDGVVEAEAVRDLPRIDEPAAGAVGAHQHEAQAERVVGNVVPADVEQPGDRNRRR